VEGGAADGVVRARWVESGAADGGAGSGVRGAELGGVRGELESRGGRGRNGARGVAIWGLPCVTTADQIK
jgi:hypothetical protein